MYIVQMIAKKAKEVKGKVETVVLVDKRPVDEQKENPYVIGELLALDYEV
ncbi:MAG TPA: hypothetical protein GX516_07880 [Thermoanaerobacter sp.]|nr:hypothetical protein [Thermoanaerobacter sp.]